jgi:hypothetical protein
VISKDGRIRCLALVEGDRDVGRNVAGNRWPEPGMVSPNLPRQATDSPNSPSDGTLHACSIRSKFDIDGGTATLRYRSVGLSESEREMAQERDYYGNSGHG